MDKLNSKLLERISNKKTLIWDFDGVLCFLNWDYGGGVDEWWDRFGDLYRMYEKDVKFRHFNETKYPDENIDLLITKYGSSAEEKVNNFLLEKETTILPHSPANKELLEIILGIDERVENFIWSNNQRQTLETFISNHGLSGKFKTIVSRGPKGYMGKPDITAFEKIRVLTNNPIDDFMFIGDSENTDKIVSAKLGIDFFHYIVKC